MQGVLSATALKQPPPWLEGAVSGVSAVGVAMVASAAKSLLIKTCSDKNTSNAKVESSMIVTRMSYPNE
jgi:chromate transporter